MTHRQSNGRRLFQRDVVTKFSYEINKLLTGFFSGRNLTSVKQYVLFFTLCFYAVALNVGMAPMSIGSVLVVSALLIASGPRSLLRSLRELLENKWAYRFFLAVIGLFLALFISLLVEKISPHPGWCLKPWTAKLKSLRHAWYLFLPFIVYLAMNSLNSFQLHRVLRFWLGSFIVVSLFALPQFAWGWPRNPSALVALPGYYHVYLWMGHHLSIANIIIFPFFATLELLLQSGRKAQTILSRPLLLIGAVLGFIALILTFSRTLWIALPLGLLFCFLIRNKNFNFKMIIASIFACLIAILFLSQSQIVQSRFQESWSIRSRILLWKTSLELFKERPLTGMGFRSNHHHSHHYILENRVNRMASRSEAGNKLIQDGLSRGEICQVYYEQSCKEHRWTCRGRIFSGHAHNNFLQMLGETGLLGTALWLFWCIAVIALTIQAGKNSQHSIIGWGMVAAWLVFHINGLTQVNAWESKVMHNMAWVIGLALYYGAAKSAKASPSPPTYQNAGRSAKPGR